MKCALWFLFLFSWLAKAEQDLPPPCDSSIYCYGDILHAIQTARIFNDGKTFVDMKMKLPESEILANFASIKNNSDNPTNEELVQFVSDNFEDGDELETYMPTDFNPNLEFFVDIENETVRSFAVKLVQIWPQLARRVKADVANNSERYSFLPVPNAFVIPGGRFREYYYWDTYWIIEGLLISEMYDTARGMIDNFLTLVVKYGFVPNGGRIYYLQRSQPPLLTPMARLYFTYTKNVEWLKNSVDILANELNYWTNQSVQLAVNNRQYTMFRYSSLSYGPRPESYREDYETASTWDDESKRTQVYVDLKSGAESGWDFSSRWIFTENGESSSNLSHIQTRRVVPVDLNAFLCGAYRDISDLYSILGNTKKQLKWYEKYLHLRKAIHEVLWNKTDGIWYDYDSQMSRQIRVFYPSNVAPLWSKCFYDNFGATGRKVVRYLKDAGVFKYMGGVPTSLRESGLQWDFPNAWPPLEDIVVSGLANTNSLIAKQAAEVLAKRWVNSNIVGFDSTGAMFEKYDATVPGQYGGGGEYEVQSGFGWSNGVALKFVYNYYRKDDSSNCFLNHTKNLQTEFLSSKN